MTKWNVSQKLIQTSDHLTMKQIRLTTHKIKGVFSFMVHNNIWRHKTKAHDHGVKCTKLQDYIATDSRRVWQTLISGHADSFCLFGHILSFTLKSNSIPVQIMAKCKWKRNHDRTTSHLIVSTVFSDICPGI